tara:strand:+ start:797 stop:1750 length:954 start_codon:yes stop_codon:yes gene_type:complete
MKKLAKEFFRLFKQNRKTSSDKSQQLFSLLPYGLTLLDIGAAGGIEPRWQKVRKSLNYVGIEPDKRSNQELNKASETRNTYILDSFAWNERKKIEFYFCKKPMVSSAYIPNRELLDQYPNADRFDIVQTELITAEPLEEKLRPHKTDFIKLDIQGGELNALKGIGNSLDNCLGVEIEVEFSEMYKSQPLFSEVNNFLLSKGFYFSDFVNLTRWERNAHNGFGRCIFGDGLWMKDIDNLTNKTGEEYFKYSSICSLYGKLDEALASLLLVKDKDRNWRNFESILTEQIKLQRKERNKFKTLERIWSFYSPSSRVHLIE